MTKKILLDTNILVYATDNFNINHKKVIQNIYNQENLYISDRSYLEFYRVCSGPLKISPKRVLEMIDFFKNNENYTTLNSSETVHDLTFDLAKKFDARSGKIFDLNILAVAIANDIDILYTKNTKDYPDTGLIEIIDPTV